MHYNRKIITTEDGSHSLYIPELNENYHSIHGAIQESMHVFISAGFRELKHVKQLSIFELGFGTGLNALLTLKESQITNQQIKYSAIEKYPLKAEEFKQLNYAEEFAPNLQEKFQLMHQAKWGSYKAIDENFQLLKIEAELLEFEAMELFDLIYFDAFAPDIQPKLWTLDVFKKMYGMLNSGGLLVTYCAKGQVRRNMKACGFRVDRIPGPPGKREMLKATKKD